MANAMTDPSDKVRDGLFMGYCDYQRAIKDRQYKLIEVIADEQRNTRLFDIIKPPPCRSLERLPATCGPLASRCRHCGVDRDAVDRLRRVDDLVAEGGWQHRRHL